MPIRHVIVSGETVIELSDRYGHLAETIWNDPANAELRAKRSYMNALLPGDTVVVPDLRPKQVTAVTGRKHVFRRRGIPAVLRLQLLDCGVPRAHQDYTLTVDGKVFEGTSDAAGVVERYVPADALAGRIVIGPDAFTVEFRIGTLHPSNTWSGARQRLRNLGYLVAAAPDDAAATALAAFQRDCGLEPTGTLDAGTQAAFERVHDSAYDPETEE